jgi:hypothetical protein
VEVVVDMPPAPAALSAMVLKKKERKPKKKSLINEPKEKEYYTRNCNSIY